jgi:hypothetical protein
LPVVFLLINLLKYALDDKIEGPGVCQLPLPTFIGFRLKRTIVKLLTEAQAKGRKAKGSI